MAYYNAAKSNIVWLLWNKIGEIVIKLTKSVNIDIGGPWHILIHIRRDDVLPNKSSCPKHGIFFFI